MNSNRASQPWLVPILSGAAFFYFLIFAQFGYLHLLSAEPAISESIDLILLFMGLGGILGSVYCGRCFRMDAAVLWIMSGFSGAGIVSVVAAFATELWIHWIIGFLIGIFLSVLTVSIVPVIRDQASDGNIGKWVSVGVGGAYFLCNIPLIYQAAPRDQCITGAVACCIGAGAALFISRIDGSVKRVPVDRTPKRLFSTRGIAVITVLFSILIWFDSAAFYLIQDSDWIRSVAWESSLNQWSNALVHFFSALLFGWLLDKGRILESLVGTIVLIVAGYGLIQLTGHGIIPGTVIYLMAVSGYSTALVSYGALAPDTAGPMRIVARAALVFAVAGWFGSGMGIGMARDLGRIPAVFIVIILSISMLCLVYGMRKFAAWTKWYD